MKNIFKRKTVIDKQLEQAIKSIKDSISNDIEQRENQAQRSRKQQIWDAMSPRLKMRLLKHIGEQNNEKK